MRFTYCPHCGEKLIQKEIGDEGFIPFCERCSIPLWDMFTTSIIAAVVNEYGEVALIRQNYVSATKYVCVAGIMKIGESAEETVVREVAEEVGLQVEKVQFVKSYPYEKKEMLMLGYRADVKKKDFELSGEVDSAEWFKPEEVLDYLREGSIAWQLVKDVLAKTEVITLQTPTSEHADDIMNFCREILDAGDEDAFAGCGSLGECDTAEKWLVNLAELEKEETCPEGYVTSNTYIAVRQSDNKIVGVIDLRHHIDHPILGWWGGHMGYSVRPSERGKGYAIEMLKQNLQKCRERGMEKVMITCDQSNTASERTILANGGVFEKDVNVNGQIIKRYWITL